MSLAQLETPYGRVKRGCHILKILIFPFADNFFYLIAIKFCALIEDGLYSVIAGFQETL